MKKTKGRAVRPATKRSSPAKPRRVQPELALRTTVNDIDKLKRIIRETRAAKSAADRANRTKDEFLATLSHELRNPLNSILMRAQLLRRGSFDDAAKVRRAGEAIEAGAMMQVQLIDDLLDVSKIVTGKIAMDLRPVVLARTVVAAIDGLRPAADRKAVKFDIDLVSGGTMRDVYGDETRLQQVVTNLLTNAIKFTPKSGTVSVSLASIDGNAVLRVKDTGIGIEASFLPYVFDRFTQANRSTTRAYGGLGLGLAIVRHLVDLHHGTVVAESSGPHLGATFTVTLPLMKAVRAAGVRTVQESSALDFRALKRMRVLVVDDDVATREVIADLLSQAGANVRLAQSSSEGMRVVKAFRPEILLCDIAMPDEDGYAFIRKVRALGARRSGNIPALALTALARDEDRARALAAGYQIHLAKPVDIDRLRGAVLDLATIRRARRKGGLE